MIDIPFIANSMSIVLIHYDSQCTLARAYNVECTMGSLDI